MHDDELRAINDRLHHDQAHWWTRWTLVQGRDIAVILLGGFVMGLSAAGIVLTTTGLIH